jgi:hypothetical protein
MVNKLTLPAKENAVQLKINEIIDNIPDEQVQSNWNETDSTSKAYIKNKPTIPSVGNGTITVTQGGVTKGTFTTNQSGNSTIALDAVGSDTDVQINGTSITSDNVANIVTNTAYNASSNKIATMNDLPTVPTDISAFNNDSGYITGIDGTDVTTALGYTPYDSLNPSGYQTNVIETVKVNNTAQTVTNKTINIIVPVNASDVNALPNTTKYAASLSLGINSSTYVITGQLKDQNGDNLGTA